MVALAVALPVILFAALAVVVVAVNHAVRQNRQLHEVAKDRDLLDRQLRSLRQFVNDHQAFVDAAGTRPSAPRDLHVDVRDRPASARTPRPSVLPPRPRQGD